MPSFCQLLIQNACARNGQVLRQHLLILTSVYLDRLLALMLFLDSLIKVRPKVESVKKTYNMMHLKR
uniref:Uncharacterized protein n=1 Tax=Mesocestoides corti TaxID=53468 RepID=A0A5K3F4C9_MESCO